MTVIAHAHIAERIDSQPTERLTPVPPLPAEVSSALAWAGIDTKPATVTGECETHYWCEAHSIDIDGSVDHRSALKVFTVTTDPHVDRQGVTRNTTEMGMQATAAEWATGESVGDDVVSVWIGDRVAMLTDAQALEIGAAIMVAGAALGSGREIEETQPTVGQNPTVAPAPARRRSLRDFLDNLWYHRPVFMTYARLDEIEMGARMQGMSYADRRAVSR
jgi:hypothetical protein